VRRWVKLLAGALVVLVLLPVAVSLGIRVYVAAFMRASRRAVVDRHLVLSNGGAVDVHGVEVLENTPHRDRDFTWAAAYRAPGSTSEERIGDWVASREGTTAHVWRDLVVVIPNTDYFRRGIARLFVRTATGRWREIQVDFQDLADGIDPPMLSAYKSAIDPGDLARIREAVGATPGGRRPSAWIEEFLPDRGEVRVLVSAGSSSVKLRLGLADDGERLNLLEMQNPPPARP
jgi:hypothetical protein